MASSSMDKHSLGDDLDDDISFFRNINSQVVSTPQVNGPSRRKFDCTPSDGLSLSMLVSPSNHQNVTYSNLNTEEKKVFLPSEHCKSVNISRCDSSFDRTFEPKPIANLQDQSPLLFDSEINKSSTKQELLNGAKKIAQHELDVGQSNKSQVETKARSITFVNETPEHRYRRSGISKEKGLENHLDEKEFSKLTTERKINSCKVLFDSSDCSLNQNNEIDSPINITTVTPSYEKLKSSLNNSKKSNNETKIDNFLSTTSYLDELIDLKSEDKSLIVKSEARTPTRNNVSNSQVVPRMLSFASEKNGTNRERCTSPNLDDTVRNETDTRRGQDSVRNESDTKRGQDNNSFPNVKFVDTLYGNLKNDLTLEKECFGFENNFIYPNELYNRKEQKSLNDKVWKINVNKESILELETIKEMSDVNESRDDERHKTKMPRNVKGGDLMSFSQMMQSSQTCDFTREQNEEQSNQNSKDITNTQLNFIFEKIERDHQNQCSKIDTPIPDVNAEINNVEEYNFVETSKNVELNTAHNNAKQNGSSINPEIFTKDLVHIVSKEECTQTIPCSISNDIEKSKTQIYVESNNSTGTVSIKDTQIDKLKTNYEHMDNRTVSIASENDSNYLQNKCNNDLGNFSSFKSASGKKIDIDPHALIKSKQLFAAIDEEIKNNTDDGFKLPINCSINPSIPWNTKDKNKAVSKDMRIEAVNTNSSKSYNSRHTKYSDQISSSVDSRELKSQFKVPIVHEKTKPSVAFEKPSWDGFEDSFIMPQTQDILLQRQRKYKDVKQTLVQSEDTQNISEQNSNDISDSQFHQLGEFVEKHHELSANDQCLSLDNHSSSHINDKTNNVSSNENNDIFKTALEQNLEGILLKSNTSTLKSISTTETKCATRSTSPDLWSKDKPSSAKNNSSSAPKNSPSKSVSEKGNVSIKPIRSSRSKSPDFSSTKNERTLRNLDLLENDISIPLDKVNRKSVGKPSSLPLVSVENVKTRRKKLSSRNLDGISSSSKILSKLEPRQHFFDKQGQTNTDNCSTKLRSMRSGPISSSPDLTMGILLKVNEPKSEPIKLKIEKEEISKKKTDNNSKCFEIQNGFQGFYRDRLLLSTRKYLSYSFQDEENNFVGFPNKSGLKITSRTKKDFILKYFLNVNQQADMSERKHSVCKLPMNLIQIKNNSGKLPLKSNDKCSNVNYTSHTLPNHRQFKSADEKKIHIVGKSLENARKLLGNIDHNLEIHQKPIDQIQNSHEFNELLIEGKEKMSKHFIKVSESAITNRKRNLLAKKQIEKDGSVNTLCIMDSLESSNKVHTSENDKKIYEENNHEIELAVDQNEASRQNAKQILDRFLFDDIQSPESKSEIGGFASTSDNKMFSVPEESPQKAKQLLDKVDVKAKINDSDNAIYNHPSKVLTEQPHKLALEGFASASGKKIVISETSLEKAKQLLDGVDTEEKQVGQVDVLRNSMNIQMPKLVVDGFAPTSGKMPNLAVEGFAPTNGKKITVAEENLQFLNSIDAPITDNSIKIQPPALKAEMGGFASASGKKITVSEESLQKAKLLLSDAENEEKFVNIQQPKALVEKPLQSAVRGFASASGKQITVSEESLQKAKQLLKDGDIVKQLANIQLPKPHQAACGGFASASGKKISVSKESLEKAKQLLENVDDKLKVDIHDISVNIKAPHSTPGGFSSASGKEIVVSSGSLQKAKNLLDKVDVDEKLFSIQQPKALPEKPTIGGFASASGKKITVSEESVQKAKQLLNDAETEEKIVSVLQPKALKSAVGGFASANGKKITVSEESLQQAKQLLNDAETEDKNVNILQPKDLKSAVGGFASASGKKITVSEESLQKAKLLLSDTENEEKFVNIQQPNALVEKPLKSAVGGFASASGKKITVSEESLQKAKQLLNDAAETEEKRVNILQPKALEKPLKSATGGFASASGKKITVSEESLKKVKVLLDKTDLETTQNCGVRLTDNIHENNQNERRLGSPDLLNRSRTKAGSPDLNRSRIKAGSPDLSEKCSTRLVKRTSENINEFLATEFNLTDVKFGGKRRKSSPYEQSTNKRRKLCFTQTDGEEAKPSVVTTDTKETDEALRNRIISERMEALSRQRKQIDKCCELNKKGLYEVTFEPGTFYKKKQSKSERVPFTRVTNGKPPGLYTTTECAMMGVKESILTMSPEKASSYLFTLTDHYKQEDLERNTAGIVAGDNVRIILNRTNSVGLPEIQAGFRTCPHVSCVKVSDQWVENHFTLIVWKLCCLERSYPDVFKDKLCTLDNLLFELKYRYDCEMENQTSCLKKVVQCDNVPNKRMVLCVSRVFRHSASIGNTTNNSTLNTSRTPAPPALEDFQLELTDGWYRMRAVVDDEMKALVARQRVKLGTKLITCNAEMYNNDQGCDPLQIRPDIYLKLHTNSTRRAHYQSRLGYCSLVTPLTMSLSSVLHRGGLVSQLNVILARIYPTLYLEKNSGGKSIIRNEKMENRALMKFEKYYEKQLEMIYTRLKKQAEVEETSLKQKKKNNNRNKISKNELKEISSGEDLYNLISSSFDSDILHLLSNEQLSSLEHYKQSLRDRVASSVNSELKQEVAARTDLNRQVTSLLKIKIYDVTNGTSALLTIWRPDPSIREVLQEGKCVRLQYVMANGFRYGETQLSTTKHTQFIPSSHSNNDSQSHSRIVSLIGYPLSPRFGEIDLVGLVVCIVDTGNKSVVYLANERTQFVAVNFWNGVKESGYEDIIQVSSVVACTNLQYRTNTLAELSTELTISTTDMNQSNVELCIPSCYSTEHSVYARNPRSYHLSQAHTELTAKLNTMDLKTYIVQCESVLKNRTLLSATTSTLSRSMTTPSTPIVPYKVSGLSRKRKPSLLEPQQKQQVVTKKSCHQEERTCVPSTNSPDQTGINISGTDLPSRVFDSRNELSTSACDSVVQNMKSMSKVCQSVQVTPVTNRLNGTSISAHPTEQMSVSSTNLTNTTDKSVSDKDVSSFDCSSISNTNVNDSFNVTANDSFVNTSLVLESTANLTEDLPSVNVSKSIPGSRRSSLLKSHSIVSTSRTNVLNSSTNNVTPRPTNANAKNLSTISNGSASSSNVLESSLNHSSDHPSIVNNSNVSTPNPKLILHKGPNSHLLSGASKSMINLTSNSTSTPTRSNTSSSLLTSTPKGCSSSFGAQFEKSFVIPGEKNVTPIQKKINVLERYGEPPPLTPGILSLRSKKLLKPFRVPKK